MTWLLFASSLVYGQIQGVVLDSGNMAPVEGAKVRIQFQSEFVITGADGTFSLDDSAAFPYVLTASAWHYFNTGLEIFSAAGTTNVTLFLDPVVGDSIPGSPLNRPLDCEGCHTDIYAQWVDSPMKKTGLNTWVFDLYDGTGTAGGMNGFVYQRDSIHRDSAPNSDCSACHSPVHWLADIENNGMGRLSDINEDMRNGVQCEVCHRAREVDTDQSYLPGVQPQSFDLLRDIGLYLEYGRLGDATYEEGIMRPAFNPQLGADLCSACHEDNVDHDGDGLFNDPGSLPHETTYSEWRAWRALSPDNTQECVDCHMPAMDDDSFCLFVTGRQPGSWRSHDIRGTTPGFLENALTLNVDTQTSLGDTLVNVTLTNDLAGHAVPTGVVVRNVILLVEAFDQQGQRLALMEGDLVDAAGGVGDPAEGNYTGLPGQAFYRNMTDGVNEQIFYTDAQAIVSDTRIQPGAAYQGQFRFALADAENVDLNVRVIYRRAFREMVLTKGWTQTGHGEPLADIQPPHFGHLMEQATEQLDICGPKDLDGNGVAQSDLFLLGSQWLQSAPFGPANEPTTNVKHLISLVNCL